MAALIAGVFIQPASARRVKSESSTPGYVDRSHIDLRPPRTVLLKSFRNRTPKGARKVR